MKTRVPEIIACIDCCHNIVAKLYEVDTTINSAQGHFHTVHNPAQPAYTVYCINCGHFITNDPDQAPQKPAPRTVASGAPAAKRAAPQTRGATDAEARSKGRTLTRATVREETKPTPSTSRVTTREQTVQTRAKEQPNAGAKKSTPQKPSRGPRKKAK